MPFDLEHRARSITAVDGQPIGEWATPATALETAEVLAEARERGQGVSPIGGATALALGNVPERVDVALSTRQLGGIVDYEPTDLVLSVGAGSRLGDVQAVLAEHGQRLPIDPPGGPDATIGGLIATARWGPLRYSAGTLRDLLIGIAVAHPSGTVSKAGGMVVKNVSGYDMPRLYLGSLGTLGVITSANFKVLPRPRAEATLVATMPTVEAAFAAAWSVHTANEPVAAIEVLSNGDGWTTAVRIEGREPTVEKLATRAGERIRQATKRRDGEESVAWWAEYVARQQPVSNDDHASAQFRCSVRPRDTAILTQGIVAALANLGIPLTHVAASPGIGAVFIELTLDSAEQLAEVQQILLGLADVVTLLSAPPAWKSGLDVWGRPAEGFAVSQALRQEFDPDRVINPGRFAGFL